MTGSPLTGTAAAEALSLHLRLGAAGARFDSRRVLEAVRTRAGRLRVLAGLALAVRIPRVPAGRVSRPASRRRPRRSLRAARGSAAPDRPRLPEGA